MNMHQIENLQLILVFDTRTRIAYMCTCLLLNDEECDFSDVLIVSRFEYISSFFYLVQLHLHFLPICLLLWFFKYMLLCSIHLLKLICSTNIFPGR